MPSTSGLFFIDGDDVVPLVEQSYNAEDDLQALLAKHPELLPGEAIDPDNPRRFLLVDREVPIAGLKLDHLFLDQEAVPTLIETKRGTNREGRREVVAQMLDYAANAAGQWDADKLESWTQSRLEKEGRRIGEVLAEFEHSASSDDDFWEQAEQNLRDGKVRLIFVSDEIPTELQRIVEYMNERMTPTEVLAAEVRQYVSSEGKSIVHASLVGQTEKAREVKGRTQQVAALPALIEAGTVKHGDDLWVLPSKVRSDLRPAEADDPVLRFRLVANDGSPHLVYEPPDGETKELKPSMACDCVRRQLGQTNNLGSAAVAENLSHEPGGPSLADLARSAGIWT
jgi:hypothetical protein